MVPLSQASSCMAPLCPQTPTQFLGLACPPLPSRAWSSLWPSFYTCFFLSLLLVIFFSFYLIFSLSLSLLLSFFPPTCFSLYHVPPFSLPSFSPSIPDFFLQKIRIFSIYSRGSHPGLISSAPPGNIWQLGRCLVLLIPSGERPGMLPNIVQCTGQTPRQRTIQPQNITMPRLRNPDPPQPLLHTLSPVPLRENKRGEQRPRRGATASSQL